MTAPPMDASQALTAGRGRGHAKVALMKLAPEEQEQGPVITMPPELRQPSGVTLAIQLRNPVADNLVGFILENRKHGPLEMAAQNMYAGKQLAICGAGPSLANETIRGVDEIFACNSALPYLVGRGVRVTAGVGIDQTDGLQREWAEPPDVPYFCASSCDPALIAHLKSHGRRVLFFHNAIGIEDELDFLTKTWPEPGYLVGEGFTVVSRMIGLALWLGFERVDVYGADCALGPGDIAHANGEHVATAYRTPLLLGATIDGREWRTRPDMLRDAVSLVRRVRHSNGRVRLMGDTLPVALLGKSDAFLDLVSRDIMPGEMLPALSSSAE